MITKGWIEKQMDANGGARYRITPAGEAALKAKIPDRPGDGDAIASPTALTALTRPQKITFGELCSTGRARHPRLLRGL
jgi:DNA-binding PadR family transcriptional regulator